MTEAALQRRQAEEALMESDCLGLRPIEQAVLWRMLEQGAHFTLFALRHCASTRTRPETA